MRTWTILLMLLPGSAFAQIVSGGVSLSPATIERVTDAPNAKLYGLACDGVTDDRAALATAITAIGSATKTLAITDPCYLGTDVTIPTNITILKTGAGAFTGVGRPTYKGYSIGSASANSSLEVFGDNGHPAVGGQRLAKFGYNGGLHVWDWTSVCPDADYNTKCNPTGGAMLSVGSDLGATGFTVALANNGYAHDFIAINKTDGYQAWTAGTRRFTFTDPGLLVFGDKASTAPALKPSGAALAVRLGDDSADASLAVSTLTASSASGTDAIRLTAGARINLGGTSTISSNGGGTTTLSDQINTSTGILASSTSGNSLQLKGWASDAGGAVAVKIQSIPTLTVDDTELIVGFYPDNGTNLRAGVTRSGWFRPSIGVTSATPDCGSCVAGVRGAICYVGGTAGVKDIAQICAKDSGDAYAWRTLY